MRVREDVICRASRTGPKRARAAPRSVRTAGSAIVALSAAIVACLVASVLITPGIDQVFARDGYSGRDIYAPALEAGSDGGSEHPWVAHAPRAWRLVAERVARWTTHPRVAPSSSPVRVAATAAPPTASAHTVCVRLCDGYHFPIGDARHEGDLDTQAAVCSSACPDAPTRLFTMPSAGGDIDEALAVSNGQPYAALPVAYAHTTEVGPTCTCHRDGEAQAALLSPLNDVTLRRGDSIMTPIGWRVFRGTTHWPYRRDDFSSLRAARLPARTRSTLVALEDATLHRSATTRIGDADLNIRVKLRSAGEKLVRLLGPNTVYQR